MNAFPSAGAVRQRGRVAAILTRVSIRRAMRLSGSTSPTELWRNVRDVYRGEFPTGSAPEFCDSGLFRKYARGVVCPRGKNAWFRFMRRWPGTEAPYQCGLDIALHQRLPSGRAVDRVYGRYQSRKGLWHFPNDAQVLAAEDHAPQLQRDLHFYWMARGDEYGTGMLALAMRLTFESQSSEAEKSSILCLFINAANVLRTDPDFAPEASALMQLCFENLDATPGGRPFAENARSQWQFLTSLPSSSTERRSISSVLDWARTQFPRIDRRHPYHPILLTRQKRLPV